MGSNESSVEFVRKIDLLKRVLNNLTDCPSRTEHVSALEPRTRSCVPAEEADLDGVKVSVNLTRPKQLQIKICGN